MTPDDLTEELDLRIPHAEIATAIVKLAGLGATILGHQPDPDPPQGDTTTDPAIIITTKGIDAHAALDALETVGILAEATAIRFA
jgi:hypothetical protein